MENYEETIAQLSRQCRALLELGHPQRWGQPFRPPPSPDHPHPQPTGVFGVHRAPCPLPSEQVSRRQSQVDRLYVSLKDLVEERKAKLEQQYWLYQLNREVDELEHWIAEKEVVAGSPELGQDFEHVTVSLGLGGGGGGGGGHAPRRFLALGVGHAPGQESQSWPRAALRVLELAPSWFGGSW